MVEHNKVNVKLSDSLLNKLEIVVRNQTGVTLRMSVKIIKGNKLPHELLLKTRKKTKRRKAFQNIMSPDIKFSKTQISKLIQSSGILGSLLSKIAGWFIKVAVPIAKNNLAPLGITADAPAVDAGIQKKIHGSGTTTLIMKMKKSVI